MIDDPRAVTFIGTTDFRNSNVQFGIRAKDRLRHTYIIGSTGVGKSVLIENLVIQDILAGNGVAFLDPHGGSAELILKYIPEDRIKDVIYFAPFDLEHPIGFNPLEDPGPDYRSQIADGLLTAFKRIWVDAFSARMEYVLSNTLMALLEYPGATLLSVNRMLSDKKFREKVVANVKDPSVKSTWVDEFMKWEDKFAREAFAAIQNKVGQFTANPMIRNILGQPKSTLDFREMMDTRKIFIANLSKGRVGEQNAPLIGAMLITKIYLAAMSRADKSEYEMNFLPPFYLFVDEFQNFANDSFENILSEARKYKLGLTVAHQYVSQMPETIQNAVFGNVGTKIIFRTQKPEDAEIFEKAFTPVFTQSDIMNLGLAQIYLTLLIDGVGSAPFSARTLPPRPKPVASLEEQAIAASRSRYTRPRAEVEEEIAQWFLSGQQAGPYQSGNTQIPPSYGPQTGSQGASQYQMNRQADEATEKRVNAKKEAEHAEFLEQKKKEIEDRGGVWLSPEEYKAAKEAGTLDDVMREKRIEMTKRKMEEAQARKAEQVAELEKPKVVQRNNDIAEQPRIARENRTPNSDTVRRDDTRGQAPRLSNQNVPRPQPQAREGASERPAPVRAPVVESRKNEARDDTKNSLRDMLAQLQKEPVKVEPAKPLERSTPDPLKVVIPEQQKPIVREVISEKPAVSPAIQPQPVVSRPLAQPTVQNINAVSESVPIGHTTTETTFQLTQKKEEAIYAHESVPVQPIATEAPRPTVDTQPVTPVVPPGRSGQVPGWNEISPSDLARALGTKL